ncbi:MAG: VanW family protein [Actinomycetota bacterium]|nr:VanW family protein [Actinomycetota bacterium]
MSHPVPVADDQYATGGIPPQSRGSRRRLVVLAGLGMSGIVLVLLALAFLGSDVPRGTRALGVDVGGTTEAGAAARLTARIGSKVDAPINLRAGGQSLEIDPRTAGVRLDTRATAAAAATRNPFVRAAALVAGRDVGPVIRIEQRRLAGVLGAQAAKFGQPPVLGGVRFEGTAPLPVYPAPGRGLDPARTATALTAEWLRRDPIPLTVSTVTPSATKADIDRALEDIARPALASPVTVQVAGRSAEVSPAAIAGSLVIAADTDGKVTARFDPGRLDAALAELLRPLNVAPRDAGFTVVGAAVQIVPAVPGRKVDTGALAVDLVNVLPKPAPRAVTGKLIDNVAPKLTTERAAGLGVKEQISSFTTYYPCCPARNRNIQIVADEVDGAVVLAGETFSLNGYTGPRTTAEGYIEAPVIIGGKLKNEVGGGISQFATTTFNAVFFSGLEDVFHKTHSFYISRYPAGREATVYYPSLDLKFKNDSPYAVLIDTSWTNTSVTVAFWSTKRYDITSVSGPRTNPTTYRTQYLGNVPECIATSGINGFDVTVTRVFKQSGRVVRHEVLRTRYQPETKFVCSDPP